MLNPADAAFAERLTDAGIKTRAATSSYLEEQRGRFMGQSEFVALPTSTEEVSRVVRLCHEASVPLIPYGGGTGVVGGQVALNGPHPLVLSLERMDRVRDIHPQESTLVAEAGVTLANLQAAADDADV